MVAPEGFKNSSLMFLNSINFVVFESILNEGLFNPIRTKTFGQMISIDFTDIKIEYRHSILTLVDRTSAST